MTMTRFLPLALLLIAGVACSGGDEGGDDTLAPVSTTAVTSTTAAPTTSSSSTSTTSTSTTSTTSTSSTTTLPEPVAGLALEVDGLGPALFGAEADGVVDYVTSILGDPTFDTGWADPIELGRVCPGTQVRIVAWDDLSLFFTDDSLVASGTRHFASYTYGEAFGPVISPFGLATDAGLGVGATRDALQAAYPDGLFSEGDELSGPLFVIAETLFVHMEDQGGTYVATAYVGGFGCGE